VRRGNFALWINWDKKGGLKNRKNKLEKNKFKKLKG
jgi:hypothetical protein